MVKQGFNLAKKPKSGKGFLGVLTVTLNPAVDKTVIGARSIVRAGGKGINVARVLTKLGQNVTATGFAGGRNGRQLLDLLKSEKLQGDFVGIAGETRMNVSVFSKGRMKRTIEEGPLVSGREIEEFKLRYESLLKKAAVVVLSGRTARGVSENFLGELIQMARRRKVAAVLDTGGRALALGLRLRPWLIKPNLEEAEELLGRRLNSTAKRKKAVEDLKSKGAGIVILSLGKDGAMAFNGRECILARPPRVKALNSVGCGDSLLAGFLAGQRRGLSFVDSLKLAVAAGTAYTLHLDPQKFSRSSVTKLLPFVTMEALLKN